LGIGTGFEIIKQDSLRALRALASNADFIFLDPPYEMEEAYQRALEKLSTSGLLRNESIVIAEHQKKFDPGEAFGPLRRYRKLVQGDAVLSFYRLALT
jgi:16S rRNA G966 N2-methylase RsmD